MTKLEKDLQEYEFKDEVLKSLNRIAVAMETSAQSHLKAVELSKKLVENNDRLMEIMEAPAKLQMLKAENDFLEKQRADIISRYPKTDQN